MRTGMTRQTRPTCPAGEPAQTSAAAQQELHFGGSRAPTCGGEPTVRSVHSKFNRHDAAADSTDTPVRRQYARLAGSPRLPAMLRTDCAGSAHAA